MNSRHGPSIRSVPDDEDRAVGQRTMRGLETPGSDEDPRVVVRQHRETVVLRLLERGLSAELLMCLIPEWQPMIGSVAERAATRQASPDSGPNGSRPRG